MQGPELADLLKHKGQVEAQDKIAELGRKLGVAEAAVSAFLAILGEKQVPEGELVQTLVRIAQMHKEMESRLHSLTSDDSGVQSLRDRAQEKIAAGNYETAGAILDEADALSVRAVEQAQERLRKQGWDLADTRASRADLQLTQLNFVEGEKLLKEAFAISTRFESAKERDIAFRFDTVAVEMRHWDEAGQAFERAIALSDRDPAAPIETKVQYKTWQALTQVSLGQPAEAEKLYREALAFYCSPQLLDRVNAARTLNSLANARAEQGDKQGAVKLIQEAIAVGSRVLGRQHEDVAVWLNALGYNRMSLGQFEAARRLFTKAVKIDEKTIGRHHPAALKHISNLGASLMELNRMEEAAPYFLEAIAGGSRALGADNEAVLGRVCRLAICFLDTRKFEEAEPLLREALHTASVGKNANGPPQVLIQNALGRLLTETGRCADALPFLESEHQLSAAAFGPKAAAPLIIAGNLARALGLAERHEEALSLFADTIKQIEEKELGFEPRIDRVYGYYADLCDRLGKAQMASDLRSTAQALQKRVQPAKPGARS